MEFTKLIKISLLMIILAATSLVAYNPNDFSGDFNKYLIHILSKAEYQPLNAAAFAKKYDLTTFFSNSNSLKTFGFIGFDMERIKVKVISVTKDANQTDLYHISALTNVSNNISPLKGTLKLDEVYEFKEPISKHGLVVCKFKAELNGSGTGEHIGKFNGDYYLVLSKVVEDVRFPKVIPLFNKNHTFCGSWKSNTKDITFPVLWGEDWLIEELSEFLYGITKVPEVNDDELEKKWHTYYEAYSDDKSDKKDEALKIELEEWWK